MTRVRTSLGVAAIVASMVAGAAAQQPPPASPPASNQRPASQSPNPPPERNPTAATRMMPIEVQIVISRWQADKKIASMPYTLIVNASDKPDGHRDLARLRMGAEVPVLSFNAVGGGQVPAAGPITYKAIGTNIDCSAYLTDDNRYQLQLTIEDSSVYADPANANSGVASANTPVFRSFRFSNSGTQPLRDGQTMQFIAAADKVTGEVVRVDLSVKVVR